MEEHSHDAGRTYESHGEEPHGVEPRSDGAAVGELVAHDALRHKPAYEQARHESPDGHENLRREGVAEVEQRTPCDRYVASSARQGAQNADDAAGHGLYHRPGAARAAQLLVEECRAYLVH